MKKFAPTKQAEALKWLFRNPGLSIREEPKPSKRKRTVPKMAWYAGREELSDKTIDSMEEKLWIEADGSGGYRITKRGSELAEMMCGQKTYDFANDTLRSVIRYDIDPLHNPDI